MPSKRQATLTLTGPEDLTIAHRACFDQLTLTSTQVGGYRREPDSTKPISPAAAEAFWIQFEALAAKGLRNGFFNMVDGTLWKFEARDGKKTYAATGPLRDTLYVGHAPPEDSYADLSALFEILKH